jgi:hypothetical protein
VINSYTGEQLDGVTAVAYKAGKPRGADPCAPLESDLYRTTTKDRGKYTFLIDAAQPVYYAAYCSNGFQSSAEDTANNNSPNGTDVHPTPVRLMPDKPPPGKSDVDVAYASVVGVLDAATWTLQNGRTTTGAQFQTMVQSLDADVVIVLLGRPSVSQPPGVKVPSGAPQQIVAIVLNDATQHLRYFQRVPTAGFQQAVTKFSDGEQRAIARLTARQMVGVGH